MIIQFVKAITANKQNKKAIGSIHIINIRCISFESVFKLTLSLPTAAKLIFFREIATGAISV